LRAAGPKCERQQCNEKALSQHHFYRVCNVCATVNRCTHWREFEEAMVK
jgi:hypothetical protein